MAVMRHFECGECFAFGTIKLKGDDHVVGDITCCPVCSSDISADIDEELEE